MQILEKMNQVVRLETSVLSPHYKVDEQQVYHNWVVYHKIQSHWILKEADSPGETRCRKSWDQFEKYGSQCLRYVMRVSRKRKNQRLEKDKSKFLISEVPTL